jgi:urease accessory protein
MSCLLKGVTLAAALALAASPALAHVGHVEGAGLAAGFMHPLNGFDHLIAMVLVGAWAGQRGGWSLLLVPGAFVLLVAAGMAAGAAGLSLAATELMIALSVVALGLLVATRASLPLGAMALLSGLFAFCHGLAHGSELPLASTAGVMLATALLHAAGVTAAGTLARVSKAFRRA